MSDAADDYVEFAHGTTWMSAQDIRATGLREQQSIQHTVGSYRPGSFYTIRVNVTDVRGSLETALGWGTRHEGDLAIVLMRLPRLVVEQLENDGALVGHTQPVESVFAPAAFGVVNHVAEWRVIGPFKRGGTSNG